MSNFGHIQDLFDVKSMDRNATFKTFYNCEMPAFQEMFFAHMTDYISGQILYPPGIHTLPCDFAVLPTKEAKYISPPLDSEFDHVIGLR